MLSMLISKQCKTSPACVSTAPANSTEAPILMNGKNDGLCIGKTWRCCGSSHAVTRKAQLPEVPAPGPCLQVGGGGPAPCHQQRPQLPHAAWSPATRATGRAGVGRPRRPLPLPGLHPQVHLRLACLSCLHHITYKQAQESSVSGGGEGVTARCTTCRILTRQDHAVQAPIALLAADEGEKGMVLSRRGGGINSASLRLKDVTPVCHTCMLKLATYVRCGARMT